jgi:hypothetical protein
LVCSWARRLAELRTSAKESPARRWLPGVRRVAFLLRFFLIGRIQSRKIILAILTNQAGSPGKVSNFAPRKTSSLDNHAIPHLFATDLLVSLGKPTTGTPGPADDFRRMGA